MRQLRLFILRKNNKKNEPYSEILAKIFCVSFDEK